MSAPTARADSAHSTLVDNRDLDPLSGKALSEKDLYDVVAQPMADPATPIQIDVSRTSHIHLPDLGWREDTDSC